MILSLKNVSKQYSKQTQTSTFSNYQYAFNYTDHLGNVRLTYADSDGDGAIEPKTEIISEKNYYPFGLQLKGYNDVISSNSNSSANKFQYSDKELQDELGLNIYDFGARNYDAALGRWFNLDPLSEMTPNNSTYTFVLNNPILFKDPDGMRVSASSQEAQDLIINSLNELFGENHGFYFNKKGDLDHKKTKDHRKAKKSFSSEQLSIFTAFSEVVNNEDHTIDVSVKEGDDTEFTIELRNQEFVKDSEGKIVRDENGVAQTRDSETSKTKILAKNPKVGHTGGSAFGTADGFSSANAVFFPGILKTQQFNAGNGSLTVPSLSAAVIHELVDHGLDFVRNGNDINTRSPGVQNVKFQNSAFIIIGSPTRTNHTDN